MTSKIRIILINLLITRVLLSQEFLNPEIFSTDKGLLNPSVNSLIFDLKGFLWAGTENGLYRYDGYQFILPAQTQAKTSLIKSKKVLNIQLDQHTNNIWFLTEDALELYNRKTGMISAFSIQSFQPDLKSFEPFIDFFISENHTIWIISESTIFKMTDGLKVSSFAIPQQYITRLTCLKGDKHGNIWIGTNNGILVFDANSEKFTELFSQNTDYNSLLTDKYITKLYIDSKDNLWIGTRNGFNRFDPVDIDFEKYYPNLQKKHPDNEIRFINEDNKGNLIIITNNNIIFFNPVTSKFSSPDLHLNNQSDITEFTTAATDKQGQLWIGTNYGIVKIREKPAYIENITIDSRNDIKLLENNITSIYEGTDGKLWLGYLSSGISCYEKDSKKNTNFLSGKSDNINSSENTIQTFYINKTGNLYVVSSHMIHTYNAVRNKFEPINVTLPFIDQNIFRSFYFKTMVEDSAQNLWIGTNKGILYFDRKNSTSQIMNSLKKDQDSIVLSTIYDVEIDELNNLWICCNEGLIYLNNKLKQYNRFTPYDKVILNTGHKKVYSIAYAGDNMYWLGTSEGCYQFDVQKKTFSALPNNYDLLNLEILSLTTDNNNNLWMSTSKGIHYFSPISQSYRYFDHNDGIRNFKFNPNAISNSINNKVYFGGKNGLTIIHLDSVSEIKNSPATVISKAIILHKGKAIREYFEVPDTIHIPSGNYALKIEFFLPDFSRPEKNLYRYQFKSAGKNAEWNELHSSNNILLGGFGQGNYEFFVIGSTIDNEWNSQPARLYIIVDVPFWRSKLAYTIYLFIILLGIIITFRYWTRQLIRANKEYKEKEKIAKQIMLQKEELTLKNKSITDSINYARRIQNAILPPLKLLKSYFPQSFLLYMPKDIVSGDFYWVNKLYNKIFIAAVDCTGHGVPGAFMSIIGFELFRKITNIEGLTRPSDILNKLNEDFHEIFKDVDNIVLRDGMDVAFCAIDINDMILEYAGAFCPLYLIRDNKITEIKGDRFAIGLDEINFKDQSFKNHMIPLQEGDIIYIFSDGYADQFGGPDGKKFKYRRFRHLLLNIHQLPMESQQDILETSLREWKGEHEQVDDIMVIGIKVDF
jgi:ligand-binding sensor domain-containing protein/serine phosphatase RsbU (regulator of sigma subunit)